MRTKIKGMGRGEQPDEGPGEECDAIDRVEGYEDDDGALVLFDSRNVRAWIKSTLFGIPVDRQTGAGNHEGQPDEDADE